MYPRRRDDDGQGRYLRALDERAEARVSGGSPAGVQRVRHRLPGAPGTYEVDHLIPLELGGDNGIANLWPEAADPPPGFHQKDKVENWLHEQVCSGAIRLADAQRQIATDWITVWKQIEGQAR